MKKRILCLLLCVVMLAACLAGCGKKTEEEAIDDVNKEASESAMTLAMYLLCEEEMSEEQQAKIEEAVNKITKSKFKTRLDLRFYTADEYYTKLEEAFAARTEAEAAGLISQPVVNEDETTEEETVMNEYGFAEIAYPDIANYQVDIFYLGGYEKFAEYMEMNMLQNLNEELSSASKKLNEYISAPYLTYMKSVNKGTYAIPTNKAIGEYTYLLINKEALADQSYNTDAGIKDFTSMTDADLAKFLGEISAYRADKYVPIYTNLSNIELATAGTTFLTNDAGETIEYGIKYWGIGEDGQLAGDFSLIGSNYNVSGAYGKTASYMESVGDLMKSTAFNTQFSAIMDYQENGYFAADMTVDGKDAAVMCLKGGAELPSVYADKYEAVVIGKPTITTEALYEDMFAVASYTTSTSRSMEIITYLNTNEDFRNLLLYGIEGENYELVDSDYEDENGAAIKVVRRLNEDYMMDPEKLGNTLIGYVLEGENPMMKDFIMEQNTSAVVSTIMGFRLDYNDLIVETEKLETLRAISQTAKEKLNACTFETYEAVMAEIDAIYKENAEVINALSSYAEPADETTPTGIGYVYQQWAIANKLYTPPAEEEA